MSGPEDGARDTLVRALVIEALHGRHITSPAGYMQRIDWADAQELAGHVAAALSVVADTTAGGAECICSPGFPSATCPLAGHRAVAAHLAARSGGAQDDGLRERLTQLVEDVDAALDEAKANARFDRDPIVRNQYVGRAWGLGDALTEIRRALAGPDDARQDGAE